MRILSLSLLIVCLFGNACNGFSLSNANQSTVNVAKTNENIASNVEPVSNSDNSESAESQTNQPKTVREFFNLLPSKYFTLEGCEPKKDKNCNKARKEYIKTYLEVEDTANGYWKSGCDGAQSCLTMALFKRPDATYIVHILTEFEAGEDSYFLEYKGSKWADIGAKVIPNYSQKNTYIPPRQGTTIEVFKKNFPEPTFSERGEKIYDLAWQNGRFIRK